MTTMAASSTHEVAVALPLMVCLVMTLVTITIHAIAMIWIVSFVRHHHRLGRTGVWFWLDVTILSGAIVLAGAAHLVVVFIWAVVFVLCGQFGQLSAAFYTSAILYTTLGTGEVAMSSSWKLLGPFETADGMLAFGMSTAIAIFVAQLMLRKKFPDLPNF
jgi:hypothetical protein